jgi:hypothetical protein
MTSYRFIVLLAGALAVLGATLGTGGFSAVAADRSVDIQVVDDDRAYLGIEQNATTINDTTNLTVTVTNRFTERLGRVTVTLSGEDESIGSISPGQSSEARFTNVSCAGTVRVEAAGDDAAVYLSRPAC